MSYKVYLISKLKLPDSLDVALDKLEIGSKKFKVVLIKPNICGFYPPDLKLLKAILDYMIKISDTVVIGETESTMYKPNERFQELGIINLVNTYSGKVRALDLNKRDKVRINVPNPRSVKSLPLPRLVLNADYLINLARIGSHPSTTITAALKNLFGLVAEKSKYFKYHPRGMSRVIADIAKVIKPDLNIVEVNDKVLISNDALTIDIVATSMFGIDPLSVKHFKMVAEDRDKSLEDIMDKIEIITLALS